MGCPRKPNNKLRHVEVDCSCGVPPQTQQQASPRRSRSQPAKTYEEVDCIRGCPRKPNNKLRHEEVECIDYSLGVWGCPRKPTDKLRLCGKPFWRSGTGTTRNRRGRRGKMDQKEARTRSRRKRRGITKENSSRTVAPWTNPFEG